MPLAGLWGGVWRYQLAHTTRSHLERRNDISLVSAQAQSLRPAVNEYATPTILSQPLTLGQKLLLSLWRGPWALQHLAFLLFRGLCLCSTQLEGTVSVDLAVVIEEPHGFVKHQR